MLTKHLKLKAGPGNLSLQCIGPFRVLWMIRCNAAEVELPLVMKVNLVFIVALLNKY